MNVASIPRFATAALPGSALVFAFAVSAGGHTADIDRVKAIAVAWHVHATSRTRTGIQHSVAYGTRSRALAVLASLFAIMCMSRRDDRYSMGPIAFSIGFDSAWGQLISVLSEG